MAEKPKPSKKWTSGFCSAGNHRYCKGQAETPSVTLVCDCKHHRIRKVGPAAKREAVAPTPPPPKPKLKVRRVKKR